ncbi:CHAT domain-containing protein, partial [Spirulina sp. CCNP1310]|uniref:CHAT domain-containing protein n=1 Tax=Spirulina sp. CCNP1310 TaxID=3110249 RepID=UPI002B217323
QGDSASPTAPTSPSFPLPPTQPPTLIGYPTTAQPLEFAQLETILIHHLNPTAQPLTENQVTPDAFTQALQTPAPAFHFSGHGSHNSENPNTSALYLAHDHPFTLEDLNSLPTIPIPLICLAACETGITATGEFINEFVGFPAVFLKKGSQTILSTLWTVNETSSMIFVVEFFRHYQTHHNPTAAFHHAQTHLQTLTWSGLAQWYRAASDPNLKRTIRDGLKSLASNIEDDPDRHPPDQTPYAMPYHWAGFILTTAAHDAHP